MVRGRFLLHFKFKKNKREDGEVDKYTTECPTGGELKTKTNKNESYNLRGNLTWNKMLNDDNNLTVSLIGEIKSSKYSGFGITRRGYLPDRGMIFDDWATSGYPQYDKWHHQQEARGQMEDNLTNQVAIIATTSYSWKNTYTLNANMRMDWSNKFGDRSNEKFLPIWSVSGRWNMHDNLLTDSVGLICLH